MYRNLYPTGSSPGKFNGLLKCHQLIECIGVDKLPLRPIVSNIGTAIHNTAKYLAKLLALLNDSEYNVKSTKHFLEDLKGLNITNDLKFVSFDVTSLFTNVLLEFTIDII